MDLLVLREVDPTSVLGTDGLAAALGSKMFAFVPGALCYELTPSRAETDQTRLDSFLANLQTSSVSL